MKTLFNNKLIIEELKGMKGTLKYTKNIYSMNPKDISDLSVEEARPILKFLNKKAKSRISQLKNSRLPNSIAQGMAEKYNNTFNYSDKWEVKILHNKIKQVLAFLDDRSSTVGGWREIIHETIERLAEKYMKPVYDKRGRIISYEDTEKSLQFKRDFTGGEYNAKTKIYEFGEKGEYDYDEFWRIYLKIIEDRAITFSSSYSSTQLQRDLFDIYIENKDLSVAEYIEKIIASSENAYIAWQKAQQEKARQEGVTTKTSMLHGGKNR
jgi:hypothetical protein